MAAPGVDLFEEYFRRADLDRDGRIGGAEAVAFFQGSNLPKPVLAQVWTYADQNRIGYLGRQEFYNALKLVTVAQSGRTLRPEIVKSALLGPAASKIPAPKINPVSSVAPPINSMPSPVLPTTPTLATNPVLPSSNQFGAIAEIAPNNLGVRPTQTPQNAVANQQFFATVNSNLLRPTKTAPTSALAQTHSSLPGGGSLSGVNQPSSNPSNLSSNWLGDEISGGSVGLVSENSVNAVTPSQNPAGVGASLPGITTEVSPRPQTQTALASSVAPKALDVFPSSSPSANQQKSPVVSGNGLSSDYMFGGDTFSANSQMKSNAVNFTASMSSSVTTTSVAAESQKLVRPGQLASMQNSWSGLSSVGQHQWSQSNIKQNQTGNLGTNLTLVTPGVSPGPASSASNQNQPQWPKISQSDIKKYTKVFVDVDKDRDGKITGVEARNLFLSWRLPREVLKQVWDLSDQDNDSMLSLREFCIALYLMERYREGHPIPDALPNSLMYDETLLCVTSLPSGALGARAWQPGLQQQMLSGSHPSAPVAGLRPPMQNSTTFLADGTVHSGQQISGAMENHMMNRLVKEKPATDMKHLEALEPTQEVGKQILDSREKIEFYRTKMQDLVLYKSRCDNRLNEITERASADRREVELLGKKYEEKYKQVGELASKLAVEEARYRDIQERKMELHNATIKMQQGGSADGLLQVRVDRIQSDLEELEKALIDCCKQHSVNVKATTSVQLPFGWQPIPQDGAAVWDENWDKFEDEGFTVVKDLTDLANNPTAKPISPSFWSDKASDDFSPVASSSIVEEQIEISYATKEQMNGSAYDHSEEGSTRSPRSSSGRSTFESPFNSVQFGTHDMSPSSKDRHSDQVGADSTVSGDKYSDEPWTFDDADPVWGSNTLHAKDGDLESIPQSTFFTSNDFSSMKVDSPSASSVYGKERRSPFFEDSVPSSPVFNSSSPSKFNERQEDHSFNNFGRFDSFSTDSGLFPARDGLSRFDSMSGNKPEGLSRFDSISSSRDFGHSRAFESFDDADPFVSSGPFRASGGHSPKRDSDNWRAF